MWTEINTFSLENLHTMYVGLRTYHDIGEIKSEKKITRSSE